MKIMAKPPYSKMAIEVEEMKDRLSNVFEFDIDENIYYLINELYELMADKYYGDNRKYTPVMNMLNNILGILVTIMNEETIKYAETYKLLPVSGQYLE